MGRASGSSFVVLQLAKRLPLVGPAFARGPPAVPWRPLGHRGWSSVFVSQDLRKSAMQILSADVVDEKVCNLMEVLAAVAVAMEKKETEKVSALKDMEMAAAVAIKDKDMAVALEKKETEKVSAVKDMEIRMTINACEKEVLQMRQEKLQLEAKAVAILCNRHLVEMGLHKLYPAKSMTKGYDEYAQKLLLNDALSGTALAFLESLPSSAKQTDVAREFKSLIHELSKDIHYPELEETGFVCGGPDPLGSAVAVAVLQLQADGALDMDVIFVDFNFKRKAVLSKGNVIPSCGIVS